MPAKSKAHYAGTYKARRDAINRQARANPSTKCWRCGRTLAEHPPHRNGRAAFWTTGHILDGNANSPLAPEASTCNLSAGASAGNRKRVEPREPWP